MRSRACGTPCARNHCVNSVCAQRVLLQGHGEPHEAVTAGPLCLQHLSPSNIRADNLEVLHGVCQSMDRVVCHVH